VHLQIKSSINGFEGGISIKLFWEAGFLLYKKNEKGTFLKQKGPFEETSVLFTATGLTCVICLLGQSLQPATAKAFSAACSVYSQPAIFGAGPLTCK